MSRRLSPVVAAALLAGCGRDPGAQTTLRVDIVSQPAAARALAGATGAGLVAFDAKGEVVPALASSWRVANDGLSVIFRLRSGDKGTARPTAAEVVAGLRRVATAARRGPARDLVGVIANGSAVVDGRAPASTLGVDAPTDRVVEVRAAGAISNLLPVLAQPELAGIAAGGAAGQNPMRVVATGPREARLVRQAASDPAGTIVVTTAADPGSAVARFAHDRTDLVIGDGMAGFDDARLMTTGNVLRVEPAWGVYGYRIRARGPLADVRVRRALAMAIDRDGLGGLFGLTLTPVLGLIPPLPGTPSPALPDWALQTPAARLDLARQLLVAAGIDAAHPLTVTISLPDAREHAAVAAAVAAGWAQLGVTTTTVVRSAAAHAAAVARGDYSLALVEQSVPVDSALLFLTPFGCRETVRVGLCDPAADALVEAARTARDPGIAATTLASAEAAMVADTPLIALFVPIRWALVAKRVTGWFPNAAGQHPLALLGVTGRRAAPR